MLMFDKQLSERKYAPMPMPALGQKQTFRETTINQCPSMSLLAHHAVCVRRVQDKETLADFDRGLCRPVFPTMVCQHTLMVF